MGKAIFWVDHLKVDHLKGFVSVQSDGSVLICVAGDDWYNGKITQEDAITLRDELIRRLGPPDKE